jgi:hypothetical protein
MAEESRKPANTPTGAVFLSYTSQDAEAAQRICAGLRSLRTGNLRALDARREGYFRREWKLAVDRTADMAEDVAFLLPVVIDSTPDATARVPDRFREVQWSRLPDGQTSPAFIERVRRLLSPEALAATQPPVRALSGAAPIREWPSSSWWSKPVLLAIAAVIVFGTVAYFWIPKHATPSVAAFAPPPHSIAVMATSVSLRSTP